MYQDNANILFTRYSMFLVDLGLIPHLHLFHSFNLMRDSSAVSVYRVKQTGTNRSQEIQYDCSS